MMTQMITDRAALILIGLVVYVVNGLLVFALMGRSARKHGNSFSASEWIVGGAIMAVGWPIILIALRLLVGNRRSWFH